MIIQQHHRSAPFFCVLILLIVGVLLASAAFSEQRSYDDSWGLQGLSLQRQDDGGFEATFSVGKWSLDQVDVRGELEYAVHMPGVMLPNDAGAPDLPGFSRLFALPNGAKATFRVIDMRTEIVPDVDIAPAFRIPREDEEGPLQYEEDPAIYSVNAYYPAEPIKVSDPLEIRGVRAARLGITPFQYNPVTRELRVLRDIRLEVTFSGGDGVYGQDRLRNRWWDRILGDAFINGGALGKASYQVPTGARTPDYEYVIICPPQADFMAWADTLRTWRNAQGIRTGVYTTDDVGGNTTAAIEAFINDAYDNWDVPPAAVLLLGDYASGTAGILSPIWDSYCVSDNIYADRDGDDLPDIALARITANNDSQLSTMIGKMLDYERQPPTDPGFYAYPLMAGGWQTERWFILCEEVLAGFLENELGKSPVKEYAIYSGTPGSVWSTATNTSTVVNYFGPSGLGYIPSTPTYLTDWTGNATGINNAINSGTFIVQHRDHGAETGWGEPSYSNSSLSGLTNDQLTFVLSINCLTGKYNWSNECFAEAFHRHAQGALGLIAASETSYSFVNDVYVWGMYDDMWPDFDPGYGVSGPHLMMPAFANVAGKIYLDESSWPYNTQNKVVTYHLFHHHGDAFMDVYTEVPQPLTVAHDGALLSGVPFFVVTADPGALIGLSVDGEYLGAATATGSPQSIPIEPQLPGGELTVTVTMQNHTRYVGTVPIIPPEGSYVVYSSSEIDDTAGNANGLLDYGESVLLSVALQNVGLAEAQNVEAVIATVDTFVTLLDDSESYGNIPAGETASQPGGFGLALDLDVPDAHPIPFTLTVTDDDSSFVSYFSLTAHAPDVQVDTYVVADGDDNVLDPGESADLEVTIHNHGSADVASLDLLLTSLNPNVTVTSGEFSIPSLGPDESTIAVFSLSADAATPIGELAEFTLDIAGPLYSVQAGLALTVGLRMEDFESGNFVAYAWEMGGSADWTIDTADPHGGANCARSGTISHSQSSTLSTTLEVLVDGTITFWYKVSSESSYDYLRFAVDGAELGSWSGTVGWAEASFPVTAGVRTFTWSYTKDGSVSTGSDCGWIDDIVFPAVTDPPMPYLTVSPLEINTSLTLGDSMIVPITLENTGEGELEYTVNLAPVERGAPPAPALNLKKDQPDPRPGVAPGRGSGGPDLFGHTWMDSDEVGGPDYEWVEINSVGTAVGTDDDANYGPFPLGFSFEFYGLPFGEVRICTNGWLSFTSTATTYTNALIPAADQPNNLVAPFWDDMDPGSGGLIYYYADSANQRFIVEYDAVHHYPSGNPETFEVILDADGTITFQYKVVAANASCTVGIENATGGDGLQVLFNTAYLHSEMAIRITHEPLPTPWLTLAPLSGTVAPASSGIVEAIFRTEDCQLGTYQGMVTIVSNAPNGSLVEIPVTLLVEDGLSDVADQTPRAFALVEAYPNPFNPTATIEFDLPVRCAASLRIYDLAGRLVRTLVDRELAASHHRVVWDGLNDAGRQVPSGTYFYRLRAGQYEQTRKMMLVK
jgi:hypothetical protein